MGGHDRHRFINGPTFSVPSLYTKGPLYDDLINNYEKFHEQYSQSDLLKYQNKWKDDSDYSNYPSIFDLLEDPALCGVPDVWHVVRVPIPVIWSSEESLGGCDRPLWSIEKPTPQQQQVSSLSRNDKGFSAGAAQVLSGKLRPHPRQEGVWQLVKFIGNNRVAMKLLAHAGKPTEILMSVSFHEVGLTQKDYIRIESELHATDAGDRSGQNELQKFISGFRAGRSDETYCFDFLNKHRFNYGTLMQQEGVEKCNDYLEIKSLQGIKNGKGKGHFKKYGEEHVGHALRIIHRLSEITGEKVIHATPVESLALMYSIYTQYGKQIDSKNTTPLFTVEELDEYFIKFFEFKRSAVGFTSTFEINDLSWSSGVKDVAYVCAKTFWPTIVEHWMTTHNAKIGWSLECAANKELLNNCTDKFLKKEIRASIA